MVLPEQILMSNRVRTPSISELTEQVNSIAKYLMDLKRSTELAVADVVSNPTSIAQTRTLDTDFVISTTHNAVVFYTISLVAARFLSGTDVATVNLMVDGMSVSTVENKLTVTLALGIGITIPHQKILMGFVPAGSIVNLTSSGTGTSALAQSMEVIL